MEPQTLSNRRKADLSLVHSFCSPSSQLPVPRKDLSCQRGFPEALPEEGPTAALRTKIRGPVLSSPDGVFEKDMVCAILPVCSWEGGELPTRTWGSGTREPQCGKVGLSSRAWLWAQQGDALGRVLPLTLQIPSSRANSFAWNSLPTRSGAPGLLPSLKALLQRPLPTSCCLV